MKKSQEILLGLTGVFLCILLGIFIGRNFTSSYISVDKALNTSESSINTEDSQDGRIDINSASSQQLQLLPGIGESLAQRVIAYRTTHGEFQSIEDLLNVSGIGEKKFEAIAPYIKVGGRYENSGS